MDPCLLTALGIEARVPSSTYRLQMHEHFTFEDASRIVPYLQKWGVGDAYLSPIFQARPHSMHGYDVTRHDRLNPELGDQPAFDRFAELLRNSGPGSLLDVVPNGETCRVVNDQLRAAEVFAHVPVAILVRQ
jgi:(1->4)-alpha-D-glucan 1-alpha-D-glucosylmutase